MGKQKYCKRCGDKIVKREFEYLPYKTKHCAKCLNIQKKIN